VEKLKVWVLVLPQSVFPVFSQGRLTRLWKFSLELPRWKDLFIKKNITLYPGMAFNCSQLDPCQTETLSFRKVHKGHQNSEWSSHHMLEKCLQALVSLKIIRIYDRPVMLLLVFNQFVLCQITAQTRDPKLSIDPSTVISVAIR
jgi:hypothetical protein